jgi:hypothetical protein
MFGWMKRRLEKEHRKLAWQNFAASHEWEMKLGAAFKGDWDRTAGYNNSGIFAEYFILQWQRVTSSLPPILIPR